LAEDNAGRKALAGKVEVGGSSNGMDQENSPQKRGNDDLAQEGTVLETEAETPLCECPLRSTVAFSKMAEKKTT